MLPLAARTFSYKLTPDAVDVARRLADLAASQRVRRVALLAADGLHGDSGVRAVRSALRDAGVDLVRTVRLPATGRSFAGAARRIATVDPDGVIVWGTAPDSGTAARELRRADYTGPLYFDAGAVAADTLADANAGAVEGAYAVHPACLDTSALSATSTTALERRTSTTATASGTAAPTSPPRTRRTRSSSSPRRPGWPRASTVDGCGRSCRPSWPRASPARTPSRRTATAAWSPTHWPSTWSRRAPGGCTPDRTTR
ncbi:hypothetical protein GCM10010169_02810 [Micromonospora fulviviridis]|nr:hypothetical protein GCM10010169_02810 [Micromonospora fulviviridis]